MAGTAEAIADGLAPSAWMRLSAGDGTKGAGGLYDWAYCELADLDGADHDQTGLWTRGLLIRRGLTDGERACFTTWCPAGTPIATLAGFARSRSSLGARLRSRAMGAEVHVSSMDTSRSGSRSSRPSNHASLRLRTSGRS